MHAEQELKWSWTSWNGNYASNAKNKEIQLNSMTYSSWTPSRIALQMFVSLGPYFFLDPFGLSYQYSAPPKWSCPQGQDHDMLWKSTVGWVPIEEGEILFGCIVESGEISP